MGIDTLDQIRARLAMKLGRDAEAAEIKSERDRQMRAWYGGMAVAAATIPDKDEL